MATPQLITPRRRVAIVDDNPVHRKMLGQKASLAGLEPILFENSYDSIPKLVNELDSSRAHFTLCDHRLREGSYAGFDGAEAVAALYDVHRPAILVTDYGSVDVNGPIRIHRRRIPVLIPTSEIRKDRLLRGLDICEQEVVMNQPPLARIPRRALVLIDDLIAGPGGRQVVAFVPQWNPNEAVIFPESIVPLSIRGALKRDQYLVAKVNIDAEKGEDLFFDDIQLPPDEGSADQPA